MALKHLKAVLRPDPSRTVIRPFFPDYPEAFRQEGHGRAQVIAERVLSLPDASLEGHLEEVTASLDERHRDVDAILLRRFDEVKGSIADPDRIDGHRRRLIGAYFSEEYSFEAAALFNPCAVKHGEQENVPGGAVRIFLSLRGIGEGHVSSVTFRTGYWWPDGELELDSASETAVAPIIQRTEEEEGAPGAKVCLRCEGSRDVSETVIFPVLPSQSRGVEDVRLVHFHEDDGSVTYHGTYTAFDGQHARSELLTGIDFQSFIMQPLGGASAQSKGMALFPRKVGGRYAMLGRQDSESIWLLRSDRLLYWDDGVKIISPRYPWEFVQMGNCGSPIELDEGWLVLTHGVGTVRNYCLGAALLDRDDPSKLLARTPEPLLQPGPEDRDGYVPNVVYSCGGLVHDRTLLLPYGVADSYTAFASIGVDELLGLMN